MAKCPVCETQHTENNIETCSVCGYDLTPYPPVLGQIPPEFLEKEKKRILAAKRVWERSQIKVAEAEAKVEKLETEKAELNSQLSQSKSQKNSEVISPKETEADQSIFSRFKNVLLLGAYCFITILFIFISGQSITQNISHLLSQEKPGLQQGVIESQFESVKQDLEKLIKTDETLLSQLKNYETQVQDVTKYKTDKSPSVEDTKEVTITSKPTISSEPPKDSIPLISYSGVDFNKLKKFLEEKKWKEADAQTSNIMLALAGKGKDKYLDNADILNFPCGDLKTIDDLWIKYSDRNFGFSVQSDIYRELAGTTASYRQLWEKFGNTVGWIDQGFWVGYNDLILDSRSKKGTLPVLLRYQSDSFRSSFFSRLQACKW